MDGGWSRDRHYNQTPLTLIDRGKGPFEADGSRIRRIPVGLPATLCHALRARGLRYHDDPDRPDRVSTQQAAILTPTSGARGARRRKTWRPGSSCTATSTSSTRWCTAIGDRAPAGVARGDHRVPRERESDLPIARAGEAGYVCTAWKSRAGLPRTTARSKRRSSACPGGRRHRHECRSGGRPARRGRYGCRVTAALDRPDHRIARNRAARRAPGVSALS